MTKTNPPAGHGPDMFVAPALETADFPVVVIWSVVWIDGQSTHGSNLVHTQSSLDQLFRQFRLERQTHGSAIRIKLMHPEDLTAGAEFLRRCDDRAHNPPGIKHAFFCHECGRPTRIVKVVDED